MSRTWARGSTTAWRKLRAFVLERDGYTCQIRLHGVCIGSAPLHAIGDTPAGHAHHTLGRSVTGDDPDHIVAACAPCNLATGDPLDQPDPPPHPRTRW